jgi:anaerobic selenocysteine-containing dehydrogenase
VWNPDRACTELVALALAMIHVLIEEKLYDSEFVETGPWFQELQDMLKNAHRISEGITHIPVRTNKEMPGIWLRLSRRSQGRQMFRHADKLAHTMRAIMFLIALTGNYDRPVESSFPWTRQSFCPISGR